FAQDCLLSCGVVLVYNVKECVMQRLSRCLNTQILTSIDTRTPLHLRPPLGTCDYFKIQEYELEDKRKKRLMFFGGCHQQELCCTVLIRGGTEQELRVVKSVMKLFLLITYSAALEQAFLNDCHAYPITNDLSLIRRFDLDQYIQSTIDSPINNSRTSICQLLSDGFLLSTTPLIKYPHPYILSTSLVTLLPHDLYKQIFNQKVLAKIKVAQQQESDEKSDHIQWYYNSPYNSELVSIQDKHPFIKDIQSVPNQNQQTKSVYAHYRACGGRVRYRHRRWWEWLQLWKNQEKDENDRLHLAVDPLFAGYLDLRSHLYIAILYSAHCSTLQTKQITCRQPDILELPAYSIHDTTL
ncbi:unnamed protein product, partial [Didymodactylos carnosus]